MSAFSRYRIAHRTTYQYSEPVAICQNQLRMVPRAISSPLFRVDCLTANVGISPDPDMMTEHTDYFGNHVVSFAIESSHSELAVQVQSEVSVRQHRNITDAASEPWQQLRDGLENGHDPNWLETNEYLFESPRVRRSKAFLKYAEASFHQGRCLVEAAMDLTHRIHQDFRYDPQVTHVETSIEDAFQLRAGVCQDFAHIQIACLRSIGLPARYVSGYLRTEPAEGARRLIGADQSHAWVSLYAGPQLGWIDLDPTNDCATGTSHVPICFGRDYSDVTPMRGVVIGGGAPQLEVSVDVENIDGEEEYKRVQS